MIKEKEYQDEACKCTICREKYLYNFENDLEGTKPHYLMGLWFNNKTYFAKLKKKLNKKEETFLDRSRAYICIGCALVVNEALMKHLKNFNMQRRKFEKEMLK